MAARKPCLTGLVFLAFACVLPACATTRDRYQGSARVWKKPPVIERRVFDRRNPPADMPELEPKTSAVTTIRYGCAASVRGPVVSRRRRGGEYEVTCRIDTIEADLDCTITVWIPRRARQIWIDHEEGHRVIAERAYEPADAIARHEARKLLGKTFAGTGQTSAAATSAALSRAATEFMEAYQAEAHGWSKRVGDRFDEITDHSENQSVTVEDAIRQAFEDEPPPESATAAAAAPRAPASARRR
ncbi:MAG TPA: hypothetical protein VFB66_06305 [Tepidisphaeraceae bacterium]|nr:hypothetical protein [Tepidisphaeraceae bacterium]